MINEKSKRREIADLQRFLSETGYLDWGPSSDESGEWGADTSAAVIALYEDLGWDHKDHDKAGTWISAAALAAAAAGMGRSGGGSMTRSGGGSMTRGDTP
jgi:hypothetical protein